MAEEQTVIAKYDYCAENPQELNIKKNEKLILLDDSRGWWKVQNSRNKSGYVPSNYVKKTKSSKFFSSLRKLGRKNTDGKVSNSPVVSRNGDTGSDQNSTSSDIQICDPSPAVCKYNYQAQRPDELSLIKGEKIMVLEKSIDGWWKGRKSDNVSSGWFPSNYVELESDLDTTMYSTAASLDVTTEDVPIMNNGTEPVIAMYPYTGVNKEELSFEKGEKLVILEKPSYDPDWWKAQNGRGEHGLVPRTFVQSVEDSECETAASNTSSCTPQSQSTSSLSNASNLSVVGGNRKQFRVSGPLADKDWYYGKITRQECEDLLKQFGNEGDFLIRDSESAVSILCI